MIIRIIRDGSSERSRSSVMFAAKMSRVREKILIWHSAFYFRALYPFTYTRDMPAPRKWP
jgi:hypothetical protein